MAYAGHIEKQTLANNYFRHVIFTGKHAQLVLMSLKPKEEIGNEVHKKVDQFFRIESGEAKFVLNQKNQGVFRVLGNAKNFRHNGRENHIAKNGDAVIIPAGTWHNVINAGTKKLKLYTIYSPPNHPDKTIHKTKADAEKAEAAEKRH